jgi:L-aspartate oxidase
MSIETDFLVIGSGIGGLSAALKLAEKGTVAVITKKHQSESNTNYAQGGIASVFDKGDSYEQHIQDTLTAGAGLCHEDAVRLIVEQGPLRVQELFQLGVHFTQNDAGQFDLGREGGHHHNRIVHVKDHTGRDVESALLEAARMNPRITIHEHHMVVELITEHQVFSARPASDLSINCWGAYVLDINAEKIERFIAKATILASGGCGQVYLHTTNPSIATGDGIAFAFRAGAAIANMEFMQFHPTTLYHPEANSFLISEAVRGFGGKLIHRDGESFMEKYHPMAALAPRDIVARAIDTELKKRGVPCVYLDVSHLDADAVRNHFPNIYENCLRYKIDITREPIPVVPAAHYACGGVQTDLTGRSSIHGLFACGEVTCTGVHGANRLASNSLLEAVVFAHEASQAAIRFAAKRSTIPSAIPQWDDSGTFNQEEWVLISHDRLEIQNIMWDYVGIVRSNARLERALSRIRLIRQEIENYYKRTRISEGLLELRNLATVAQLITQSAMLRRESRGLHYTTDYPKSDDDFRHDTLIDRTGV